MSHLACFVAKGLSVAFFLTSNLTILETLPTHQIPDVEAD